MVGRSNSWCQVHAPLSQRRMFWALHLLSRQMADGSTDSELETPQPVDILTQPVDMLTQPVDILNGAGNGKRRAWRRDGTDLFGRRGNGFMDRSVQESELANSNKGAWTSPFRVWERALGRAQPDTRTASRRIVDPRAMSWKMRCSSARIARRAICGARYYECGRANSTCSKES
jgi:hypothetical protein